MKAIKISALIVGVILVLVAGACLYISLALPNTGEPPAIKANQSTENVERGKYLAHHVAVCMDCHSTRDWNLYSGPIAGNLGGGGESFRREAGFPGNLFAPNITPFALGNWTDGEIFRAITTGVNKDGKALFPLMAYHRFGKMSRQDILSIIAYLRTIEPVENEVPESALDFPINFLVNTMPQPAALADMPAKHNRVAYGAYLINAAGCVDCHSKVEQGKVVAGTEFGGGMEFRQRAGILRSPNITFGSGSAVSGWSREFFIQRFQHYADSGYQPVKVMHDQLNTPMPWTMYAGMTSEDLGAIYDYLKTIKPIQLQTN